MIEAIESFIDKRLTKIDAMRTASDSTFDHKFFIKKRNVVTLLVNKCVKAINDENDKIIRAGGTPTLKITAKDIKNLAESPVYRRIYNKTNIGNKITNIFGNKRKIKIKQQSGTTILITFKSGRYAETRTTAKGTEQNKIVRVMEILYFDAMSEMKKEIGKKLKLKATGMFSGNAPAKFATGRHPGLRAHGVVGATTSGAQTTIGVQALAEGYDQGVLDVIRELQEDYPEKFGPGGDDFGALGYMQSEVFNPLSIKYNLKDIQDYTTMSLDRGIVVEVEYGDASHNSKMADYDKDGIQKAADDHIASLIKALGFTGPNARANINEISHLKGSNSFIEKAKIMGQNAVLHNLIPLTKSGKLDMRFKANKSLSVKARKEAVKKINKGLVKNKKDSSKKIVQKMGAAGTIRKIKNKDKSSAGMMGIGVKGATTSPIALKELIQAQLSERLLDNMGTPALVNRTGRLRRSAQVQNVMVGPKGGTEVQYTYMKDPYATFEPGGDMGSRDRDPRKLIGGTIREIAMELTGNKFIRTRSL